MFCKYWTWYGWYIVLKIFVWLFVCLSVSLFFLFKISCNTHKRISWKFCKYQTWFGWDIVDLKMFCLFVLLFFGFLLSFGSSWDTHSKISQKFHKYQTWFGWDIVDIKCVFFVCLFVFRYFCLNHLGIPIGRFPEPFVNIGLDLSEILSI